MVLCLLSRDSHGDKAKLNHGETVRGPRAISPEKSEILQVGHIPCASMPLASHMA